jgi:hypothetical protein
MGTRVVPKLSEWKPLTEAGWTSMDEAPEKCFKALDDSLGLIVRLRMIGRTHPELDTSHLEQ